MFNLSENVRRSLRASVCIPSYTHAVNELVANSIDANATRITVEVDPGKFRLSVEDDGDGITSADLRMVGAQNHTSKGGNPCLHHVAASNKASKGSNDCCVTSSLGKKQKSDLDGISPKLEKTTSNGTGNLIGVKRNLNFNSRGNNNQFSSKDSFGFRGEALAALGSVAVMDIMTRSDYSRNTFRKIIRGGKEVFLGLGEVELKRQRGTTVTLMDLFYNLPVRRKQMIRVSSWKRRIVNDVRLMLEGIVVSYPHINVLLIQNMKGSKSTVFSFKATKSTRHAFEQIYGKSFFLRDLPSYHWGSYNKIEGLVCPAHIEHSSKDLQFLFVNGKHVNAPRKIENLISLVYKNARQKLGFESQSGYAVFILSVSCKPSEFDILLEPKKSEVMFTDISAVLDGLLKILPKALGTQAPFTSKVGKFSFLESDDNEKECHYNKAQKNLISKCNHDTGKYCKKRKRLKWKANGRNHLGSDSKTGVKENKRITKEMLIECTFLGQLDNKFILSMYKGNILCFDQHAVHERIRLEQFEKQVKFLRFSCDILGIHKLNSTLLVELTQNEHSLLQQRSSLIQSWGFRWVDATIKDLKYYVDVLMVPMVFNIPLRHKQDFKAFIVEEFLNSSGIPKLIRKCLVSHACRGALKFGDKLKDDQCIKLLGDLAQCDTPFQCAHGRPSVIPLATLEKSK